MSQQELFPKDQLHKQDVLAKEASTFPHFFRDLTRENSKGKPKNEPASSYEETSSRHYHQMQSSVSFNKTVHEGEQRSQDEQYRESSVQVRSNKKKFVKPTLSVLLMVLALVFLHQFVGFWGGWLAVIGEIAFTLAIPLLLFSIVRVFIVIFRPLYKR